MAPEVGSSPEPPALPASQGPAPKQGPLPSPPPAPKPPPPPPGLQPLSPEAELRFEEARKASDRGWVLIRLEGKRPIGKKWQLSPPLGASQLKECARKGNLGLLTGPRSGVVVIDDDTPDGSGAASLDLPETVTVETGSGKRHYYFKAPKPCIGNSPGGLPGHVDVRGEGGQVVYPGSIHPETGRPYRWLPGHSPDEIDIAELPEHVLKLLQQKSKRKRRRRVKKAQSADSKGEARNMALASLNSAAKAVAEATQGRRNTCLNNRAHSLGDWIQAGFLSRGEVEDSLGKAAASSGLDDDEIRNTLKSALDAGTTPNGVGSDAGGIGGAGRPIGFGLLKITVVAGFLPEIVSMAEHALLVSGIEVYQRGDQLVRVVRTPATTMRDAASGSAGRPMILLLDRDYLLDVLTRVAEWFRVSAEDIVRVDCPVKVARTYLARAGEWKHPILLNVIETPTLRPNGSLLATPGYDPDTCLLFDPGDTEFPDIPDEPTREEAQAALKRLRWLLKDFPWLEPCDRSVALAAILTALVRPTLRTAPMFAFRAPRMASGKSLLADVVAMVSTGRVASVMSQGKDEEEAKKRMLAILMEGTSVACIDNIEEDFGGASLCSILTQESWRERILGKTATATVPTCTTWLATGNNIRFVGDIITRVLPCDLDPQLERPEERVFDVNLHEYIPEHRGELVAAGLTVLRAFHVAGQPDQGLRVFGRFEQWSDWIRSPLVWLGEPDPCDTRARLTEYDPVSSLLGALLRAWHELLGSTPCTAAEVLKRASSRGAKERALLDALAGVVGDGKGEPARRLGKYLSKYQRRLEASMRVERVGDRQGAALWRVVRVDGADASGGESAEAPGAGSVGFEGLVGMSAPSRESKVGSPAGTATAATTGATADTPADAARAGSNPPNPRHPRGGEACCNGTAPGAGPADGGPAVAAPPGEAAQDSGSRESEEEPAGSREAVS